MRLRYLIGKDADPGTDDSITVIGYDATTPPKNGAKYVNLLDEKGSRQYGPYLPDNDMTAQYGEPVPDPKGEGFWRNLREQLDRAKGFNLVELDNLDSFDASVALLCFDEVARHGLKVLIKNPLNVSGSPEALVKHPSAVGIIVEKGAGSPANMQLIRNGLPVWFVSYGDGRNWAQEVANQIRSAGYPGMGVTYSSDGEYGNAEDVLLPTAGAPMSSLAQKIVAAAERRGAPIDRKPGEINIIYVEGMDADGNPNRNRVNAFDDLRCVIDFVDGQPRILGSWEATTAPGERYTENPINDDGAAIIALGYQHAWQVGMHRGDHKALVQTGGSVRVARDANKDYARETDVIQAGYFGINQHWGYDQPKDDIGAASAGCLVGRTKAGHREFMKLVESDPRYQADSQFIFGTTVVTAKDVAGDVPVANISGYRSLVGGYFATPEQTDLPASIRYNNPGAVNAVAWNKALPGYAGNKNLDGTNTIAIYYTPEQGVAMWWELMRKYASGGNTTVGAIIDKYGGGQNYSAYKSFVVSKTGFGTGTEIDLDDDDQLLPFAKAMFWYEAGRSTPLADKQILYGFDYARAGFKEPAAEPEDGEPIPDPIEEVEPDDQPQSIPGVETALKDIIAALRPILEKHMEPKPVPQQPTQSALSGIIQMIIAEVWEAAKPQVMSYIRANLLTILGQLMTGGFRVASPTPEPVKSSGPGTGFWPGLIGALVSGYAGYKGWVPMDVAVAGAGGGAGVTYAAQVGATDKLLKSKGS